MAGDSEKESENNLLKWTSLILQRDASVAILMFSFVKLFLMYSNAGARRVIVFFGK